MKKKLFYTFIFAGIAVQLYVLTHNIVLHEMTLRKGEVHRFQTAPVDPFDAFRGQYVALNFNAFNTSNWRSHADDLSKGKKWCYVQIGTDTNGLAFIERVSLKRDVPSPYLKVRVNKWRSGVELPFTRYYMPEHLAPQAEAAYLAANRSGKRDAVAVVRVWKGRAVIEDLEIDGVPVRAYLEGKRKEG